MPPISSIETVLGGPLFGDWPFELLLAALLLAALLLAALLLAALLLTTLFFVVALFELLAFEAPPNEGRPPDGGGPPDDRGRRRGAGALLSDRGEVLRWGGVRGFIVTSSIERVQDTKPLAHCRALRGMGNTSRVKYEL
jgi:hypothetical protein